MPTELHSDILPHPPIHSRNIVFLRTEMQRDFEIVRGWLARELVQRDHFYYSTYYRGELCLTIPCIFQMT